jgi:hypothetical protein
MIDASELENLVSKLSEKKLLGRIASISLLNASQWLAGESTKESNHRWKKKTGVLGNAVKSRTSGLKSEIFIDLNRAPYGKAIYEGYKSFFIKPKNKKALYGNGIFYAHKDGRWGLPKQVKHPGWKADPFILNTFNKKRSIFVDMMEKNIKEELEEAIA